MLRRKLKLFLPILPNTESQPVSTSPKNTDRSVCDKKLASQLSILNLDDGENESQKEMLNLQIFQSRKDQVGELETEHFINFGVLGMGESGQVLKEFHKPTGFIMARKIYFQVTPRVTAHIIQDLQILHKIQSQYIVGFYGVYYSSRQLSICTEYMDASSLDIILTRYGKIPENPLSIITLSVLKGLSYLKDKHNLLHGNLKPSNILLNSMGNVKLCDLNASKLLPLAMSKCFFGAKSYMSPEQIQGSQNLISADIWALGLTIIELSTGIYPIPPQNSEQRPRSSNSTGLTIFELLNYIVNQPSPELLPSQEHSLELHNFVEGCLRKNPVERPDLHSLLNNNWITKWAKENTGFDFVAWVVSRMEKYTPASV